MAQNQQCLEPSDSPMYRESLQSGTQNCTPQRDHTIQTRKSARRTSINNRKLVIAAGDGKYNKLEYYIKEGANVNFQDRDGNTALHWAIENEQLQVIELLLRNGATYFKNDQNETPMELAERLNKLDAVKILKSTTDSNIEVGDAKLQCKKVTDNVDADVLSIDDNSVPKIANVTTDSNTEVGDAKLQCKKVTDNVDADVLTIDGNSVPKIANVTADSNTEVGDAKLQYKKVTDNVDADVLSIDDNSVPKIANVTTDSNAEVGDAKLQCKKVTDNVDADVLSIDDNSVPKIANVITHEINAETCKDSPTNVQFKHGKRNNPVHGNIYQLKVLMLFLYRGISKGYSFKLGTEIEEANKFDDLVFEYTENNRKVYRLLQAKHKLDESRKITTRNLLGNKKDDYSLIKYFLSYGKTKKANLFEQGTIKDVTVCTNIDFDFDNLASAGIKVQKLENTDDILDVESAYKQPVRYRFNVEVAVLLQNKLKSMTRSIFSTDEVHEFLDHLVFAINQPNEDELGRIIKQEIGKEFDFLTTENLYNKLFLRMLNWLQGKEGDKYLSSKEGELFFEEARRGIPILFNIRTPVQSFTGRTKELYELHDMLQGESGKRQLVCIYGLGGMGKTELARKYIALNSEHYDNKIVWINAESYESLGASFRRLASDKLKIDTKNVNGQEKEIRSIVEDVYIFFANQKSLFVFDNAEKYITQKEFDDGIQDFLPSLPSGANYSHVLITSRNKKWPNHIKVLSLNIFDEVEATDFMKKSLDSVDDMQMSRIADLAKILDFMPLALQQAASYINMRNENRRNLGLQFTIPDYINVYEKQAEEFLKFSNFMEDSGTTYTHTIFATWNITFEMIAQKENGNGALEILRIASYLSPENIPVHFFTRLFTEPKQLESAISLLSQYSLITMENVFFNIHRLLQQVIRMNVQEQKLEPQILKSAFKLFTKDNVTARCVAHAISVWNQSQAYNNLLIEFSEVTSYISSALLDGGRYEEAYAFGLNELDRMTKQPEINLKIHCTVLSLQHNIGMALLEQGKHDMALKILQEVLDVQIKSGWDHELTLNTRCNIALTLCEQDKLDDALEIYEEVSGFENILGPRHPNILSAKRGIAGVLMKQGKDIEMSEMLKNMCDEDEASLGKSHSSTLETTNLFASSLIGEGKVDEALKILLEAYDTGIQTMGKSHSTIFPVMHNISAAYWKKNDFKRALKWGYDMLNIEETVYGNDHPFVQLTRYNVARYLLAQNKHHEALEICWAAFNKQITILGPRHSDTLRTHYLLGEIYEAAVDYNYALEIFQNVLHERNIIFDNSHPDVLQCMQSIGRILFLQEKFDDAFLYFQQVLIIQSRTLAEHSLSILYAKAIINVLNLLNGINDDKALQTLCDTLSIMKRLYPYDGETLDVQYYLGLIYLNQNKHDEALEIYRDVLRHKEAVLEIDHISNLQIKSNIANVLFALGKTSEALELSQEVQAKYNTILNPQDPRTLEIDDLIQNILTVNNKLLLAVRNNNRLNVRYLIDAHGGVNARSNDGWSLLHHAVNNNNISMVTFLLERGVDITHRTVNGSTVLHIAASKNLKEVAEVLLQHAKHNALNSFVDARRTSNGSSALHIAAKKGFSEMVKFLLTYGASHNIRNGENRVPLELSKSESVTKLLQLIGDLFQDAQNGNLIRLIRTLLSLSHDTHLAVINARHVCHTISQVNTTSDPKTIAQIVKQTLQQAGN